MAWHKVALKNRGWSALGSAMTRRGTFPDADYGSRCLCCDQETETRMLFNPSAGHAATSIELPACKDCVPHIARGNNEATVLLVLFCVALLGFGLAYKNGWGFGVVGGVALAAMGWVWWSAQRTRAAMAAKGHRNGLELVAIPGLVSVRTTNPRFEREIRERNPELCEPDEPD